MAQPCFLTQSASSHELLTSRKSLSLTFFGSSLMRTTHRGARRWATASSLTATPLFSAVPAVTHPPDAKPTIIMPTVEAAHAQKTTVFVGRDALQRSANAVLAPSMCSPPELPSL